MKIRGVDVEKTVIAGVIIFFVFFILGLIIRQITHKDVL